MVSLETVILLVAVMLGATAVARRVPVPYPVLLVIVGLGLAFVPGLPEVQLAPDLVFLVFLPPILWAAAFFTSLRDFVANLRPILLLAVGLVCATTAAVAFVAHTLLPGMGWPAAIALGAIVSPPDAVAATAVAGRLGLPRRIVTILEGESLVNDATALVLYRAAVAAVMAGTYQWTDLAVSFGVATIAGIGVGLAVGVFARLALRVTRDGLADISITLLAPYVAWVLAEHVHASGVLACVAGGLYLRRHLTEGTTPLTRLQARAAWDVVGFGLNGVLFVLIGLQLRPMLRLASEGGVAPILGLAAAVIATTIAVRLAWVPLAAWLPRVFLPRLRERDPMPPRAALGLIGWMGMRGGVTLAAALALPLALADGAPFPARAEIVVTSFAVVLATLVLQGLSLPVLIPRLRLDADQHVHREFAQARAHGSQTALQRLEELEREEWVDAAQAQRLREEYVRRLDALVARHVDGGHAEAPDAPQLRLLHEVLTAERLAVIALRDQGVVSDEVLVRIEEAIDVEAVRAGVGDWPLRVRSDGRASARRKEA